MHCVCSSEWSCLVYMCNVLRNTRTLLLFVLSKNKYQQTCSKGSRPISCSPCSFYYHSPSSQPMFPTKVSRHGQCSKHAYLVGQRQKVRGVFVRTMLEASQVEIGWLQFQQEHVYSGEGQAKRSFSHLSNLIESHGITRCDSSKTRDTSSQKSKNPSLAI